MAGLFVTGTDTGVGKTRIAVALMAALQDHGLRVAAMKPVSAGCERSAAGLRNDDALALQAQSSIALPYELLNPYALEPPIAPHIAAREAGLELQMDTLLEACAQIESRADYVVVEGAGGWLVPLDGQQTLADLAAALAFPVVMVVGIRLGCINHALLTAQAVRARGLKLAGWVANEITPSSPRADENVQSLGERLAAPLLGRVPFAPRATVDETAACLHVAPLLAAWRQ